MSSESPDIDDLKAAHAEICALWKRYQELVKSQLALTADLADLDKEITLAGRKIYTLYKSSDAALNGDPPPQQSKIINHKS